MVRQQSQLLPLLCCEQYSKIQFNKILQYDETQNIQKLNQLQVKPTKSEDSSNTLTTNDQSTQALIQNQQENNLEQMRFKLMDQTKQLMQIQSIQKEQVQNRNLMDLQNSDINFQQHKYQNPLQKEIQLQSNQISQIITNQMPINQNKYKSQFQVYQCGNIIEEQKRQQDNSDIKLKVSSQPFIPTKKNISTIAQNSSTIVNESPMQQKKQQLYVQGGGSTNDINNYNIQSPLFKQPLVSKKQNDSHSSYEINQNANVGYYKSPVAQYKGPQSERCGSFVRIDDIPGLGMSPQQNIQTINPELVKVTGTLKFFFENENYGFLVGDQDNKDVFFHFDDMRDINLSKEQILQARESYVIRFAFNKLAYFGRYGLSMKAINIELVEIVPISQQYEA